MICLVICRFYMNLSRYELRDEGFMIGEYLEYALNPGRRDRDCFTIEEVLANSCNGKMKTFSHG